MSGYVVCREIRRCDTNVPVIFISAKSEEIDADDFSVKPFGVKEAVARIRAVTRRSFATSAAAIPSSFQLGDLDVFPSELRARCGPTAIDLNIRDMKILTLLHEKRGVVISRDTFFNKC